MSCQMWNWFLNLMLKALKYILMFHVGLLIWHSLNLSLLTAQVLGAESASLGRKRLRCESACSHECVWLHSVWDGFVQVVWFHLPCCLKEVEKKASKATCLTRTHFKHKTMDQHFKCILTPYYVLHMMQLVLVSWFPMYQIKKPIPPCCMYHSVTILRNTPLIFFLWSLMIELHLHHLCLSKADHENSNM